jgi:hypothetical protein
VLLAEVVDRAGASFEDAQTEQVSIATRAKSNGFVDVRAATIMASNCNVCRW